MKISVILPFLFVCLSSVSEAFASGTYSGGTSQTTSTVDSAKYARGKQIYTGKAKLRSGSNFASDLDVRLKTLQSRLPANANNNDLSRFSGKLKTEDMEALEYYLSVRYKITLE